MFYYLVWFDVVFVEVGHYVGVADIVRIDGDACFVLCKRWVWVFNGFDSLWCFEDGLMHQFCFGL